MAYSPYDLYNQSPTAPQQPVTMDLSDQRQRTADLLRQGASQSGKQGGGSNGLNMEDASKIIKGLGSMFGGGEGLPIGSIDSMTNAITPDFQSGNYGAPTVNQMGANQITPNFGSMPAASAPSQMLNGFNPTMFKGIF